MTPPHHCSPVQVHNENYYNGASLTRLLKRFTHSTQLSYVGIIYLMLMKASSPPFVSSICRESLMSTPISLFFRVVDLIPVLGFESQYS